MEKTWKQDYVNTAKEDTPGEFILYLEDCLFKNLEFQAACFQRIRDLRKNWAVMTLDSGLCDMWKTDGNELPLVRVGLNAGVICGRGCSRDKTWFIWYLGKLCRNKWLVWILCIVFEGYSWLPVLRIYESVMKVLGSELWFSSKHS